MASLLFPDVSSSLLLPDLSSPLKRNPPNSGGPFEYSGNKGKEATEYLDHMQLGLLSQRNLGAFKVPIALTNEEISTANRLISPLTVLPTEDAWVSKRYSMHPQLFVQSFIAGKLLDRKRAEEFGANMLETAQRMPAHPPCMLMDGREEMRVKKAVLSTADWNLRMSNYLTEGCCTRGVQKCTKPSEVLICNNVLFWLNAKSLFEVFQRKNVEAMYAAMPMPHMILAGCEGTDEVNGVRIRHIGKDKIHMSFVGDASNGYLQDRETWEMYAKNRLFDGHKYGYGFNILIEVYKSVGITQLFHLTKVVGAVKMVTELTPNDDFIHVYNFIDRVHQFIICILIIAFEQIIRRCLTRPYSTKLFNLVILSYLNLIQNVKMDYGLLHASLETYIIYKLIRSLKSLRIKCSGPFSLILRCSRNLQVQSQNATCSTEDGP